MSMSVSAKTAAASAPGQWFGEGGRSWLDRLPRFADAMAEVARALSESLGALSASPGEVRFRDATTSRVDELLERGGPPAIFVLAQASGWSATIAFRIGQPFVSVMVQAMFGACEDDVEIPEHGLLSPVERRIAEILAEHVAEALARGFADILPSAFAVEPIKAKPDPSRLGKPGILVTVATLVMRSIGPPVEIEVIVPQQALEAFDEELSAPGEDTAAKADPHWSERLGSEVSRTRMKLQARLTLPPMRLGDIARLKVGQMLSFATGAGGEAILSSGGTDLFRCELGQTGGLYSLRVGEDIAGPSPHKDD